MTDEMTARDRMLNGLYEPNLRLPEPVAGVKIVRVPPVNVLDRLLDELTSGTNGNITRTDAAHTANGYVLEGMKRALRLLGDLGYVVAVQEPLASTEEVKAAGLDSTGRDGDPRFPYSQGDLARKAYKEQSRG